jgi:type II secretory pathway component PulK
MEYGDFVTALTDRFGLVLGVGNDDSILDRIAASGVDAADVDELLAKNQELLRERLLRAGLARSYSDAHTEVFADG